MLKITAGSSLSASSAIPSCMRARPWPHDPVAARAPVAAAPMAMLIASSSLAALMHTPPAAGSLAAMFSSSSVNGSIGYPVKNRHPAAIAASAIASLPCIKRRVMVRPPRATREQPARARRSRPRRWRPRWRRCAGPGRGDELTHRSDERRDGDDAADRRERGDEDERCAHRATELGGDVARRHLDHVGVFDHDREVEQAGVDDHERARGELRADGLPERLVHHERRPGIEHDWQRPQRCVAHRQLGVGLRAPHAAAVLGKEQGFASLGDRGHRQRLGDDLHSLSADAGEEDLAFVHLMLTPVALRASVA